MTDIEKAKKHLKEFNKTCVLVKGNQLYSSTKKGISPMIDFIDEGVDLKGFSACDLIVGKAVAMLFCYAGISQVHAEVLSKSAQEHLNKRNVPHTFDLLTDKIINRRGDGICPMEQAVENVDDEEVAFCLLKKKLKELKSN